MAARERTASHICDLTDASLLATAACLPPPLRRSCWGILNAPATGEALAQLILDGKASSVDLAPFSPARFA